jgi:transcriptional regulator of aromatic amino acid metabolism
MMKLHSPQLVSLSEASLLHALMSETRRPNLMVVCRRVSVEAAVRHVVKYCEPPYQMVSLPGKLDLTDATRGTMLLADVAMMSLGQQMRLYDWLSAPHDLPQIVSVSSVPLRPLVDDGRFLEGLLYRLNVISLDATPVDSLPQGVTPIRPGVRYEAMAS